MPIRARVALLRTTPATILQDYERLIRLVGPETVLLPHQPTLLYASAEHYFPFPATFSPPWQLEGTTKALVNYGSGQLVLRQVGFPLPSQNSDYHLHQALAEATGIPFYTDQTETARYTPQGSYPTIEQLVPQGILLPPETLGANSVYLPVLRRHRSILFAGAVWQVLLSLFTPPLDLPPHTLHQLLVEALALRRELHQNSFALMDATTIGNGSYADSSHPELGNLLLASTDLLALDVVAATMLGLEPLRELAFVQMAHEQGLGVGDPREIELTGDAELADWRWPAHSTRLSRFSIPDISRVLEYLPWVRAANQHPALKHWPAHKRAIYARWLRETGWGQLFLHYNARFWTESAPRRTLAAL